MQKDLALLGAAMAMRNALAVVEIARRNARLPSERVALHGSADELRRAIEAADKAMEGDGHD